MKPLQPVEQNLLPELVEGAADLVPLASGLQPWRLPSNFEHFYHPGLLSTVKETSGVSIRCQSSCTSLDLTFERVDPNGLEKESLWDIFVNGGLHSRHRIQPGKSAILSVRDLPDGDKELVIYFPTDAHIIVQRLATDEPLRAAPERPKWITHGSSITHCRRAAGPGETWPAIVARNTGWQCRNLGFGGQCKFDPIVARILSKLPAARISLCLGINTASGNYSPRTWTPAVEGFLLSVRDGHPETPLLVISPILSPPRETWDQEPCQIGLQSMREILQEIVEKFRALGDEHIYYLDGLQIIGPGDESTMLDELHPEADGIRLMGSRFLANMPAAWAKAG